MKKTVAGIKKINYKIISLIALIVLSCAIGYAWFENNREALLIFDNTVTIRSNGTLKIAVVEKDAANIPESVQDADFESVITLNTMASANYKDVTGNGINLYNPVLDTTGSPTNDSSDWSVAVADDMGDSVTSGNYALIDLYFQSDEPMDIYLVKSTDGPVCNPYKSADTDKLVDVVGNGNLDVSYYSPSVLSLNTCINPSSYGIFSRNLIAAASRVAFIEETISASGSNYTYADPILPQVVLVPNSRYRLVTPPDESTIYDFKLTGSDAIAETSYKYYIKDAQNNYVQETISRASNSATGKIVGKLFSVNGSVYTELTSNNFQRHGGQLVMLQNSHPTYYSGSSFVEGAYYDYADGSFVVANADYDNSSYAYSINDSGTSYKVIKETVSNVVTYYSAELSGGVYVKDNVKSWTQAEMDSIVEANVAAEIQANTRSEDAPLFANNWIDETDFNKEGDNNLVLSDIPVGSTAQYVTGGPYFTRIKIAVWIEGCDRESDISLNSGQFDVDLEFYGVARD